MVNENCGTGKEKSQLPQKHWIEVLLFYFALSQTFINSKDTGLQKTGMIISQYKAGHKAAELNLGWLFSSLLVIDLILQ